MQLSWQGAARNLAFTSSLEKDWWILKKSQTPGEERQVGWKYSFHPF